MVNLLQQQQQQSQKLKFLFYFIFKDLFLFFSLRTINSICMKKVFHFFFYFQQQWKLTNMCIKAYLTTNRQCVLAHEIEW